jgi:hypothetical protein
MTVLAKGNLSLGSAKSASSHVRITLFLGFDYLLRSTNHIGIDHDEDAESRKVTAQRLVEEQPSPKLLQQQYNPI